MPDITPRLDIREFTVWIIYALLTAFMLATSDAVTKRVLALNNEYLVAWVRLFFACPLFAATIVTVDVPPLDRTFWIAVSVALPLEIAALLMYITALNISPISLSMPFLTCTPVSLIAVSYVMLEETISLTGGAGILLIGAGTYLLNIHTSSLSPLEPLRAIVRERGVVLMIAVACIYSITSSLGKMAIEHSSPLFFGSFYFILVTIFMTPVTVRGRADLRRIQQKDIVPLSIAGITYALMIIFHMIALDLTKVAYMISVKRMSIFFSIMYGYVIFHEINIRERTLGSIVMFGGFILMILKP